MSLAIAFDSPTRAACMRIFQTFNHIIKFVKPIPRSMRCLCGFLCAVTTWSSTLAGKLSINARTHDAIRLCFTTIYMTIEPNVDVE